MVYTVNFHTNATRIGQHLWEIDLRFAPGLPPGWREEGGVDHLLLDEVLVRGWVAGRHLVELRGAAGSLHRNVQWYRGGLVFEAHRLLYHSA